jgi:hydrogenase-4 component B
MTGGEGGSASSPALLLLVGGSLLAAASGVPGLFLGWRSAWGARIAVGMVVVGCLSGLAGGLLAIAGARGDVLFLAAPVPGMEMRFGVDVLTGIFVLPVFLVGGLGSIYGARYWSPREHPRNGRRLRLCYGLLVASLAWITLARDGIVFLVAWEVMALTNFFLITTEDEDSTVRGAGWLYLLYSHVTILGLFALFLLERQIGGDFAFRGVPADVPHALRTAIFVLAFVTFGIKAGAMPLHSWLPAAHASAPSHVSALMSGVVIKMGIYGIVRTCGQLASPPLGWGISLLAIGSLSAFFGVVFALSQHDIKRLLAYHSIENIGIILLGLGVAMVGRSLGRPEWVMLGMAGCLLHVWNHALFKALLFFGAGSVVHATGTRDLERMGGLARGMPATATLFLVGSLAICGLPPFNGFVSELFVFLGLVRAGVTPGSAWAALPAPVLAATGALAVACFVKVLGVVFLGTARSAEAKAGHESPPSMLVPMVVLAVACAVLGVAPGLVAPALERAAEAWSGGLLPGQSLAALAPLRWVSIAALTLVVSVVALGAAVIPVCLRARRRQPSLPTWGCGYAASSPRVQYTASSFAQIITSRFAWALRPRVHRPTIEGIFPAPTKFASHVADSVLDRLLMPVARGAFRFTASFRALPQGQLQRYILYILAVLLPLLIWAMAAGA